MALFPGNQNAVGAGLVLSIAGSFVIHPTRYAPFAAFAALFPGAELSEHHAGKYKYELPPSSATLAQIFETMEANKEKLGVLNYAASQPTLETIFLAICGKAAARAPASPPAGGAARAAAVTPAASPPVAVATASVGAVAGAAKPLQSC